MAVVRLFTFSGGFVPVRDLDAAARWYANTFGCRYSEIVSDDGERNISLYFEEGDEALTLGPSTYPPDDTPPIIYATNATKAHLELERKNILTYPVQRDRQGTSFFEIRDCDGNVLEVSEMP